MHLNAQWKTSPFFQNENKLRYIVSLQTREKYPLSKEDTKTLIDILSAYNWEENRKQNMALTPDKRIGWWAYHFYIYDYYIAIIHPDKRKVTLTINGGGIEDGEFLIEYSNDKPFGAFRLNGRFSSDDIKKVKQLFLKYNVNFNSIAFNENKIIKIKHSFSFYNVFYNLEITSLMDTVQSEKFVRLYNSGWNNSAESGGGEPWAISELYTCNKTILYGNDFLNDLSFIDFRDADKQMLEDMVNNALIGHDGEEEQITENSKIYYQYKNGLLHGQVKKYSSGGNLADEVIYEKGLPISYIKYTDERHERERNSFYSNRYEPHMD